MSTATLAFEIYAEVRVQKAYDHYGHQITTEAIGFVQDITFDDRFYVVFPNDEYEDMGSFVTCSNVFDADELRPAPAEPDCVEFQEFGTCIHSECMATAGL